MPKIHAACLLACLASARAASFSIVKGPGCIDIPADGHLDLTQTGWTAIPALRYSGCDGIRLVSFPAALTTIGASAFYATPVEALDFSASNLVEIGTRAFAGAGISPTIWNCALTSLDLSGFTSLARIGAEAFQHCPLATANFRGTTSLADIGDRAFASCAQLRSVDFGAGGATRPNLRIGPSAFQQCARLEAADFGAAEADAASASASSASVGDSAFFGCVALRQLRMPRVVTAIGANAFYRCASLESFTFAEGLTAIGARAFFGCRALEELRLPHSLTTIGDHAFEACTSLRTADLSLCDLLTCAHSQGSNPQPRPARHVRVAEPPAHDAPGPLIVD